MRAVRLGDSYRSITGSFVIPISRARVARISTFLFVAFCAVLWGLGLLAAAAGAHREAGHCPSPPVEVR